MQAVVLKTARTRQSVAIHRPNPEVQEGETEAKARFEGELDAMAELLGVDRERPT